MFRDIRAAYLLALLTALIVLGAIYVIASAQETHAPAMVEAMLRDDECAAPCFFGKSLHGKGYEEVYYIITTQEEMRDISVRRETLVNQQVISWKWPEDVKPRLTSQGLNMDQFFLFPDEDLNYVQFRDGELERAQFVFLIRLSELVALYGAPEIVTVGKYQDDVASLMYHYDDPAVFYASHFLCRLPRLYSYTRVWAYNYVSAPPDTGNPTVAWAGFDDTHPTCDFPPD